MNQKQYLSELEKHLRPLGKQGSRSVLLEIKGLIADSGCSDEELIDRFGSPAELAAQYLDGKPVKTPSLLRKAATTFGYSVGVLVLAIILGGGLIYWNYVGDEFDYSNENAAELDLDNAGWQKEPVNEPVTLDIRQGSAVFYWHEAQTIAFNCGRVTEFANTDQFTIERDHCLVYLPKTDTIITARQSELVLVKPASNVDLDLNQGSLRIADKGAAFGVRVNGQETSIESIPTTSGADITLTVLSRQSSIAPYEYQ